jgi:hypothetical protein
MSDKIVFKKDFFQFKENGLFETALKNMFVVGETLPRVPQPGKPTLVVEEVDVVPSGEILGTLGGSLVLKVSSAPGTINLVFCWAGKKKMSSEWGIFTISCLTDVLASFGEISDVSLTREVVALLSQEDYDTFGENEAPVLLNRLNRIYMESCGEGSNGSSGEASGLMRVLLELTGLESLPDNEPIRSFFLSPVGERIVSLLTVISNVKKSFDNYLGSEPPDRRVSLSVLAENAELLGISLKDSESKEEFTSFLDYLIVRGLFGNKVDEVTDSDFAATEPALKVTMGHFLGGTISSPLGIPDSDEIEMGKHLIAETVKNMKDKKAA